MNVFCYEQILVEEGPMMSLVVLCVSFTFSFLLRVGNYFIASKNFFAMQNKRRAVYKVYR